MYRYPDEEAKRAALELANPEHPRWNGRFTAGTDEYNEMKQLYREAMDAINIGPVEVEVRKYKTWKEKYLAYLQTPEWKEKARACLEHFGGRCAVCNSNERVDAHHRTYERLFNELPRDLTAMCRECHNIFHHKMNDWLYFNTNIPY